MGWEKQNVQAVATIINGYSFDSKDFGSGNTLKSVKITNVGVQEFVEEEDNFLPASFNDLFSAFKVKKGNIVIALTRTIIAAGIKVAIVPESYDGALLNQRVAALIPKSGLINTSFLYHFLCSEVVKNYIIKNVNTLMQPNLSLVDLKRLPIPLPSLHEQQHIVSILDKAFAAIDKAKANAEQNLKNARELFESYLQSMFENKGEGWDEKALGDVADTWGRIGWKGLTAKEYTEEGPLFLSVHSLNYGDYVDFKQAFHITQERYDESPEIMIRKDDILICKDGAGIGKLGIVPELPGPTTINSSLLLIRCKNIVLSRYLYYNLLSPIFQAIVQSRLMGATTPHLYQRDIVTFPVLLPSLSQQEIIVQKIDVLSAQTKKLEAIYQKKINDLEELKKSILQKAFNGELKTTELIEA